MNKKKELSYHFDWHIVDFKCKQKKNIFFYWKLAILQSRKKMIRDIFFIKEKNSWNSRILLENSMLLHVVVKSKDKKKQMRGKSIRKAILFADIMFGWLIFPKSFFSFNLWLTTHRHFRLFCFPFGNFVGCFFGLSYVFVDIKKHYIRLISHVIWRHTRALRAYIHSN